MIEDEETSWFDCAGCGVAWRGCSRRDGGVPENATHAVWREIRREPVALPIHREGGVCRVEVPSIGVWNGGFIEFRN